MVGKLIYDRVILIGAESFAIKMLRELIQLRAEWKYKLAYFQFEKGVHAKIDLLCRENNVNYECFEGQRKALEERLREYPGRTLVISARNTYLFPKSVVEKPDMDIINFHSGLLPQYPGRNASSWAILNGERTGGPTWHWVNAGVDTGGILWQGKCPIGEDTKAYELVRSVEEKAMEGFQEIIGGVLSGTAESRPQPEPSGERKVYLSKDVPENGQFSISGDPAKIYRLLRCMDYGPTPIFPLPRTEIEGVGCVEITGYKKVKRGDYAPTSKRRLILPLGDEFELILKYREIEN